MDKSETLKNIGFSVILASCILAGCASTVGGDFVRYEDPIFEESFDKFSNTKKAIWAKLYENNRNATGSKFDVAFSAQKKVDGSDARGYIILSKGNKEIIYTRCRSIDWLVDGTLIKPILVDHESEVERNPVVYIKESVISSFSEEDFSKIAKAQKVEYQVCNDEDTLTAEEQQGLLKTYLTIFHNAK